MNSTVSDYREKTKDEQSTQTKKTTKKKQEQQGQHHSMTTSTTTTMAFAPAPAPASVDGKKKKKNKNNIRYAERRRTSTCLFADRVAKVSVDTYKSLISESERPPQTCIATIVAHYRGRRDDDDDDVCGAYNDDDNDNDPAGGESNTMSRRNRKYLLRVIGLGVGTKFLPESILKSEIMNSNHNNKDHDQKNDRGTTTSPSASRSSSSCDETQYREEEDGKRQDKNDLPYGCRVRDLHAEVLARRAFRRYLTTEILHDISNYSISEDDQKKQNTFSVLVRSNSTTKGDDDNNGCHESNHSNNNVGVGDDDNNSSSSNRKNIKARHKYKLRPGVTLHLYTSSAPCGNATLKRFCKMSKEKFRDDLGDDE